MSQENVELVREVWAAYENGGIEATSGYYAHDAVVDDFPDLPDERTYVGFDGARERYWHFVRAWSDFSIEPVDFIDGGATASWWPPRWLAVHRGAACHSMPLPSLSGRYAIARSSGTARSRRS